jgi:hypothetical protein
MKSGKTAICFAVICASAALVCCCRNPWSVFPDMPGPPDQSFRTGSVEGYDVYIWECLNGERTVIYQYSAEMLCRKELAEVERGPVPDMRRWPE